MYESFYGFEEKPFMLTPDPRYLYLSRSHRDALNHLRYGLTEGEGFIVIVGEVGVGKTITCRALLEQIPGMMQAAFIVNPLVSELELLETILEEWGAIPQKSETTTSRTIKDCHDLINQHLLDLASRGERGVLIIDEAQNLSSTNLERIRLLSNIETERSKLLQVILVGQEELLKKLSSPDLEQLNQRISVRYALMSLNQHEVAGYVNHRLKIAGTTTQIMFTPDALAAIFAYSRGLPRLINLASDRALSVGFEEQAMTITRQMVTRGIKGLEGAGRSVAPTPSTSPRIMATILGILLIGAAIAADFMLHGPLTQLMAPVDESVIENLTPLSSSTTPETPQLVEPTTPSIALEQTLKKPSVPAVSTSASSPDLDSLAPTVGLQPEENTITPMTPYFMAMDTFPKASIGRAQELIRTLISQGYTAHLGTLDSSTSTTRYTVFVSGFSSQEEMVNSLATLQSTNAFPRAQLISTNAATSVAAVLAPTGDSQLAPNAVAQMTPYFIALKMYSSASVEEAQQLITTLAANGYLGTLGTLGTSSATTRYAVFVSDFSSHAEMVATLQKLRSIAIFPKAQLISVE